ncbi:hypothetical protein NHQ30_006492 [Ciborinia camelliae]|nr:hypothetical protein NHQ30_006492 [Ciborinia camelliae]
MVLLVAEYKAVAYILATPNVKIINNDWKLRTDITLRPKNIQFHTHLRSTGKTIHFGVTDNGSMEKMPYDLKLQVIEDEKQPADPTLSSRSPTKVESESLIAKRQNEIRTYLQYIKNGHDNIKMLEAFHQYRHGERLMMAQYFRLCDAGTVKQLRMGYKVADRLHTKPPEMFMWKMYLQLMEALAFLHNVHPKYQTVPRHVNRGSIIHTELGAQNVYLEWPFNKPHDEVYPDIKVGDFGKAIVVPIGEGLMQNNPNVNVKPKSEPPELNFISAKSDVWRAGSIMYSLAKIGQSTNVRKEWQGRFSDLKEEEQQKILMDPKRVKPIDLHFSEDLENLIQRALIIDYNERPSAGELLSELQGPAKLRLDTPWLFKKLPDWVGLIPEDNKFLQERLNGFVQPGQLEVLRQMIEDKKALEKSKRKALEEKAKMEKEAYAKEEEMFDQWGQWVEREIGAGSLDDKDPKFDDIVEGDLHDRWREFRSAGLLAGTWVPPGPSIPELGGI